MKIEQFNSINSRLDHDSHPLLLKDGTLVYALNADITGYDNNEQLGFVQNTNSNELCYSFRHEFLGSLNVSGDRVVLFEGTGDDSQIVLLSTNTCTSKILVKHRCLNFQDKIKGVYRRTRDGDRIYFGNGNRLQFLDIDCPIVNDSIDCESCDDREDLSFDCSELDFNKKVGFPCVELEEISGSIPNGSYQVAIVFADESQRFGEFYIYPEVIKLFDKKNRGGGIRVTFEDCFRTLYGEFQLVLIAHREDRATSAQVVATLDKSVTDYFITILDSPEYEPLDLSEIFERGAYYKGFDFLAENTESLVIANPRTRPDFDYRELAAEICVKPVLFAVHPDDAHKYPSLMRDEVYAIDIAWVYPDGQESHRTHIPSCADNTMILDGTPVIMTDEIPDESEGDHFEHDSGCSDDRRRYFEVYNNGGFDQPLTGDECEVCSDPIALREKVFVGDGSMGYWESQVLYTDDYPGDLGCMPIKHHKMPDNCAAPIVRGDANGTCVYVMGIMLEDVSPPVDCDGKEIEVLGYHVYISDRSNHKSILSKGLIYNMGEYHGGVECDDVVYYPNFPFNDLRPNRYLSTDWRSSLSELLDDFSRQHFTYHSPDNSYIKSSKGDTLKIYNEAIARVQGKFHYTEDYPRFQLLSNFGETLAIVGGLLLAQHLREGRDCLVTKKDSYCTAHAARTGTGEDFEFPITMGTTSPMAVSHTTNWNTNATTGCIDQANCNILSVGPLISLPGLTIAGWYRVTIECMNVEGQEVYVKHNSGKSSKTFVYPDVDSVFMYLGLGLGSATPMPDDFQVIFVEECVDCDGDFTEMAGEQREKCRGFGDFLESVPDVQKWYTIIQQAIQNIGVTKPFLKETLSLKSYAVQYTAEADYNNHECDGIMVGNHRRFIETFVGLEPIRQQVDNCFINNWCNAVSDFLVLNDPIANPGNLDNSRLLASNEVVCGSCEEDEDNPEEHGSCEDCGEVAGFNYDAGVQAVSYYVGVTRYRPSQYGSLGDYNSRRVGCLQTGVDSEALIAGDVYLTRMSVRRKFPLFSKLPLGLPDNTSFDLRDYRNVAYPTYWMHTNDESILEDVLEQLAGDLLGPPLGLGDDRLDLIPRLGECWSFGCESTVGGDLPVIGGITEFLGFLGCLIDGEPLYNPLQKQGVFYTHVTGIANYWVESEFISDFRECNESDQSLYYPLADLTELASAPDYHLPELFLYNLHYNWNGISKDTSVLTKFDSNCCPKFENVLAYSLKTTVGNLSDEWLNFKPLNFHQFPNSDGGLTVLKEIDDYNLFIGFEDAAYVTRLDETLLTDNGNQLFIGSPQAFGRRLQKISTDESGYGGVIDPDAVVMSRFGLMYPDRKRKRWLLYTNGLVDITSSMQSWSNEFMNGEIKGVWDNYSMNYYFSDVDTGWTLSYKPALKDWVSFHSWVPNNYIQSSNTFLTTNDEGIWRHNVKYSYQTYYNQIDRFEICVMIRVGINSRFQDLRVFTEWYKQQGYDCKVYNRDVFFDEVMVYNNCGSSGMESVKVKNNDYMDYHLEDGVVVSNKNCDEWSLNNITNNVEVQPYVCRKSNGWEYDTGYHKRTENGLNGRWFKVHLRSTNYPELKKLVEITLSQVDENYK